MKSVITLLLLFPLQVFGQSLFDVITYQADEWYQPTTSSKELVKGSKEKIVDFPKQHYCIKGVFTKNALAEGYIVEILNTQSTPSVYIKGVVSYYDGKLQVTGIRYDNTSEGESCTYGTFLISNYDNCSMLYKPNKAKDLEVQDKEIVYFKGHYLDCPAIVSLVKSCISIKGSASNQYFKYIDIPLSESIITKIGYNKPYELMLSANKEVKIEWNNQDDDSKMFYGNVIAYKADNGEIGFDLLDGVMNNVDNKIKQKRVIQDGNNLIMEIEYNNSLSSAQLENMSIAEIMEAEYNSNLASVSKEKVVVFDKTQIDNKHYWDNKAYYEKLGEITYDFSNGDKYVGLAAYPPLNDKSRTSCTMTKGLYKYANGDSFEGDLSKGVVNGIYTLGTTHFVDGTSMEGYWLSNYKLTNEQYASLSNLQYPSTIKNSANSYVRDNEYKKIIEAAKKEEKSGHFNDAISYYLEAKELKADDETINMLFNCYMLAGQDAEEKGLYDKAKSYCEVAKELKPDRAEAIYKIEKNLDEKQFHDAMVRKYGKAKGEMIARGEIEIGMTKEMVYDALRDDVVRHSYRIHKTENTRGKTETWSYDFDMAKKYFNEQTGTGQLVTEGLMALSSLFGALAGFDLQEELSKKAEYKYLEFRNDKLVEFSNNSFYEFDDDIMDDISTLWILGNMF